MKTNVIAAIVLGLATSGVALAQEPQLAPAPATPAATLVDLKFVELSGANVGIMYRGFILDKDGKTSWPFANKAGKLAVQFRDGMVRADTNGDGVIDGKDKPAVKPEDATLRVAASVGGRDVDFPLHILQVQKGEPAFLVLGSQAVLEGKFDRYTIRFFDSSSGGFMRDQGRMQVSDGKPALDGITDFSRTIVVDKKLWQFEVVTENRQIRLTPYTGPVASVTVQTDMPDVTGSFSLSHVAHLQVGSGQLGQPMSFVPGDYRLQYLMLMRKGGQRPDATSAMYPTVATFPDTAKPLTLNAGSVSIKVGAPFKMDFTAARDGVNVEFTDVQLTGVAGEVYRPSAQETQGEIFAAYIRSAGKEEILTKLSYG